MCHQSWRYVKIREMEKEILRCFADRISSRETVCFQSLALDQWFSFKFILIWTGGTFQYVLPRIGGAHDSGWYGGINQQMGWALSIGSGRSPWLIISPCRRFWCSSRVCYTAWPWPVHQLLGNTLFIMGTVGLLHCNCLLISSLFFDSFLPKIQLLGLRLKFFKVKSFWAMFELGI